MFSTINLTITAGIGRIDFNRPDKLNSLNEQMMVEIHQALDQIQANKEIRALVISGTGRAFCAGQDIEDPAMQFVDGEKPDIGTMVERLFKPLVMKLQNMRMPTIAAVNGIAAGGGSSIALACDFVLAAKSASFLQAFSKIGLTPDTGASWFLTRRLGMARAIGLTMLADKLPATKAAEWGLIWEALEDAEFDTGVNALAERLARLPTKALVRTRQLIHSAHSHTLEEQLSMEASYIREMGWSRDYQEGFIAFTEKRQPNFTGE
ncbi:MAG: 2-(1,2-epoxy-1,2-dihydrophenyl)acetyl-CoA isomerase [Oceanospirillaceae bacterium]|nr:2-(1,2-epoxy-1,2-dihydrophenyl)acetyl-CoA isomerase [Oceanospirillaceae bacterium]